MKYIVFAALTVGLFVSVCFAGDEVMLKDENDRVNYSLGFQIGGDFKRQSVEIRPELVVKGIQDALGGIEPLMTPKEMRATLVDLKKRIEQAEREKREKALAKNLTEGEAFLAANVKKEGVTSLPSGLQYKVIQEGSGKMPAASDTVTVHYRGTLIDGTEFDSSYSRGEPATFRTDRVITGWKEALQLMKPGAKWQLFIPGPLAYGSAARVLKSPPTAHSSSRWS